MGIHDNNAQFKYYLYSLKSTLSLSGVMFLPVFAMKANGQ